MGGGAINGSCVVWTAAAVALLLPVAILSSVAAVVEEAPVRTLGDGRLGMF